MKIEYLLLQINDASFPIGSYTQSYGLETYVQRGLLKTEDDVCLYVKNYLLNNFFYTELLSAKLAYEYGQNYDVDSLKNLDEILSAVKMPMEIRSASEKLGRRFIKTIISMEVNFSKEHIEFLEQYQKEEVNHCSMYGFVCGVLGLDKNQALNLYLYQSASSMITNAVKTVPLSQLVGQKILFNCSEVFSECIEKLNVKTILDVGISSPGFDIRCMQHEVLYSRLYMS